MTGDITDRFVAGDRVQYWLKVNHHVLATVVRIGRKRVTIRVDGYPGLRYVLPKWLVLVPASDRGLAYSSTLDVESGTKRGTD